MKFYSDFSDVNGKRYEVEITTEAAGVDVHLTMSGKPCVIKSSSNKLFDPIKSRSCTLKFRSLDWYFELYEPTSRGTAVKVYEYDESSQSHVGKVIFKGFLTPCAYNQTFTYSDEISLNAVDGISTSKDYKWIDNNQYNSFYDILIQIITPCQYRGTIYVPFVYNKVNTKSISTDILKSLYVSSRNFIDDDQERTPWKEYEVLEEMMQFLGWTLVPNGEDVWLIDYKAEANGSVTYFKYTWDELQQTFVSDGTYTSTSALKNINQYSAAGTSNVSIDDIYNKISISDNLYKIEEISPDIFDDNNHISINQEKEFEFNTTQWKRTDRSGWWFWYKETQVVTGTDFQTICRIKPGVGWTHTYWEHANIFNENVEPIDNTNGQGYYTPNGTFRFRDPENAPINTYCNTHGCLIQHYGYVPETLNNLPTSLDWSDYLTFFVCNDTTPQVSFKQILDTHGGKGSLKCLERPVLTYEIDETIFYKPASGTSWITIKGDLFYQNNKGRFGDKDKDVFEVINYDKGYYVTAPCDKAIDISDKDKKYFNVFRTAKDFPDYYFSGFPCWKMCVQIGDKFWTEHWDTTTHSFVGQWVTKENENDEDPSFYIHYNNHPTENGEEYLPAFEWISPINNNDFKDRAGVDGYAIPIAADDDNAPSEGKMKITIFTPAVMPDGISLLTYLKYAVDDALSQNALLNWFFNFDNDFDKESIPWVVFAKDFEIGYVYTDTNKWWNSHDSTNNADKVYVGYINEQFKKDFSDLQFRINTVLDDKPISRSFVVVKNQTLNLDTYLTTLKHQDNEAEKAQEYNVIDMYLDHHSERKSIYEKNVHGLFDPNEKFNVKWTNRDETMIEGTFLIDSQSYDVAADNNRINIIAF